MRRSLIYAALLAILVATGVILAAETPKGIPDSAVVRDSKEAAQRAVALFDERATGWMKDAKPFRAESVIFSRSQVASADGLKIGDPIWIVVVVNDAQSTIYQTPVGVVWIRATDGKVFESEPKPANQALQHNDPSCHMSCLRTPRASWGRG